MKTVGLLQELLHTRSGDTQFPLRVAIVISAWDLIVDTGQSVVTWIQERTPLLHQYLLANDDVIDSSFFGVSAQGASLEGENLEKLMSGRAAERAFVVNEQSNRHRDITEPLRWLVR